MLTKVMAKKSGKDKKGKTETVKKEGIKLYKFYEDGKFKGKFCPKCGAGVYMAEHKDRKVCGKCGYAEIATKST